MNPKIYIPIEKNIIIGGSVPRLAHHNLFVYVIRNISTAKIVAALNYSVKTSDILTIRKAT